MRDSTRKGLVWGAVLSLIPLFMVNEYNRKNGLPIEVPFVFMMVVIALSGLAGRFFGGDSR